MKLKRSSTDIVVEHTHKLSDEEALRRAKLLGDHLKTKYKFKVVWDDKTSSAKVSGSYMLAKVRGTVTLKEQAIVLQAADPGPALRQVAILFVKQKLDVFFGAEGDKKIPK